MAKVETPMMQQYQAIRRELPAGTLLLFRLGDFYELFDDDARLAADAAGITLTHRQGRPMAGVPYHAANVYVPKLLAAGHRVAICDQVETARPGQLVKRALTRILSPGTILEDHQLEARRPHFLLAVLADRKGLHAAWLDLSTGEFCVTTGSVPEELVATLAALDPRELLLPDGFAELTGGERWAAFRMAWAAFAEGRPVTTRPPWEFEPGAGHQTVAATLGVLTLDGFGIARDHPGLGPAGALVTYATENLCGRPSHLRTIREFRRGDALLLDPATLRNLEIFKGAGGTREGSLLAAIDGTTTAAGARLVERWLAAPARDLGEISRRQELVDTLRADPVAAGELPEHLRGIRDLARILGRLQNRLRHPRELGGIRDTLRQLPPVRQVLAAMEPEPAAAAALAGLAGRIHEFPALAELLDRALADELPADLGDGGAIADGFDAELDRLRVMHRDRRRWISDFETAEQARTGIRNLKVKYTGAFGYYLEVTKSNLGLVPPEYIRKQTVSNAERYTTPELREKERELSHAEELAQAREAELFKHLVEAALVEADALRATAEALAELDVVVGWARLARLHDWVRPVVDDSDRLDIEAGRHPVVELTLQRERHGLAGARAFVPNDTALAATDEQIMLLTGPNMAGKSTYIRQVALLTLMAHLGCPLPARRARIGRVDRIFSRVGASDELARGNSTFMVEMNETANILHHATPRSLVILDEIGRGTSTYDGVAIAWAVLEFLHGDGPSGPRTLFATHYHELTGLSAVLPRLRNHCVAVREGPDGIVFVRQVIEGAADRSYGIHVARLAGLPDSVVQRAETILASLESDGQVEVLAPRRRRDRPGSVDPREGPLQLGLFS